MDRTERQQLSVRKWVSSGCKSTIVAATGYGKTRVALMAIELLLKSNPDAYIIVVVPTEILKEQWLNDYVEKYGLSNNVDVEIINSVIKRKVKCDLLVQDEVHLYASETFSNVFKAVTYDFILCLTGTLERLDGKEEIIKQYAPVCDTITLNEAMSNSWVSPLKQYLVLLDVDLTEYNQANKRFNSYFAFFNWEFNVAMNCLQDWTYRNKYAQTMGVSPKEVMAIAADWMRALQVRKKFIASHPKKLEVCRKILDARQDKKCITFSPTIADAKAIKRGKVVHSQQKKKENAQLIEEFNKAKTGVLCSSKACKQGLDIKGLSVGIIMNVDSSKITKTQVAGRVIRFEEGKQAELFTLVIKGTQEMKWFNNSNTTDVIIINEQQLDDVLAGKEVITRKRDLEIDTKFRF